MLRLSSSLVPLAILSVIGGCHSVSSLDCVGFSQIDSLDVDLLERYGGALYNYETVELPVRAAELASECPANMFDQLEATTTVHLRVAGVALDNRDNCIQYRGVAREAPPTLTKLPDDARMTATYVFAPHTGGSLWHRGELRVSDRCRGVWWLAVQPAEPTGQLPAPPLEDLLLKQATPGETPPLVVVRIFEFDEVGCFEALGIDPAEFSYGACYDAWGAQARAGTR